LADYSITFRIDFSLVLVALLTGAPEERATGNRLIRKVTKPAGSPTASL
jgi:hypothetical protein